MPTRLRLCDTKCFIERHGHKVEKPCWEVREEKKILFMQKAPEVGTNGWLRSPANNAEARTNDWPELSFEVWLASKPCLQAHFYSALQMTLCAAVH